MKKLSFLLALVLLFSFCLGGCGQPQPNPKLDDLNMLCDTLEKNHYNLYANVSEEEFQAEREKIARQTAKMTDEEFYWSVCHLVSLVGDAHTMVGNTGEPFMTALLWSIKKFDDGWYILKLDQKNEQYLGMRVTAINDLPIDEAVERARQVISYETDSWFWNLVPQTLAWRGALEYLEIAKEGEPVTVTVEMQDGAEQSFELTATDDWDERSQMVSFQREASPGDGLPEANLLLVDRAGRGHLLHPVQRLCWWGPVDAGVCPAGSGRPGKRLPEHYLRPALQQWRK